MQPLASPRPQLPGPPVAAGLAHLSPAYFALVMATGIVSMAAHLQGLAWIARLLFWITGGAWLVLLTLNLARVCRYPGHVVRDLVDHWRGPGFFTLVAGTSVLASQFLVLEGALYPALALALLALASWIVLSCGLFTAFTIKTDKPPLDKGISGAWLLAVVATQSVAAVAALASTYLDTPWRLELNFLALSMWLGGGMLYTWMMTLIFYRCTFLSFSVDELTPPYWINMGAMAISTLVGALLIGNAVREPLLASLLPFLKGLTLLYWATGSWWIPILLMLGIWRYVYKRYPVHYDPLYWSAVFPLGMYSVGTEQMVRVLSLDFLAFLPALFAYVALVAWAVVFSALLLRLVRR